MTYCNKTKNPTPQGCREAARTSGQWVAGSDAVDYYLGSDGQLQQATREFIDARTRDSKADIRDFFQHVHQFKDFEKHAPLTERQQSEASLAAKMVTSARLTDTSEMLQLAISDATWHR